MPTYIPDGYNFDEFLRGVPGLYDDLRYTRRHMPIDEIEEWIDLVNAERTPSEKNRVWREMLIKHLVRWDLKQPDGKPAPINHDTLNKHIHRELWQRLVNIFIGIGAPDLPPGASPQQIDDRAKRLEALKSGQPASIAEDEAAAKN